MSLLLFLIPLLGWSQAVHDNKKQFSVNYANDVTAQTDKYFTNGWDFEYIDPVFKKSPFYLHVLDSSKVLNAYHAVSLVYNVYTPDLHKPLYTDRPFAAYFLLGSRHRFVTINSKWRFSNEFQLGLIGSGAGGKELQNAIHSILPGADYVEGWDTQIKNDAAVQINLAVDYQWFKTPFAELITGYYADLGTIYSRTGASGTVQIGKKISHFDLLNKDNVPVQYYVFCNLTYSYIFYNATLQGGMFNNENIYVLDKINNLVTESEIGVGLVYKKYGLQVGQHFISPEFENATTHSWGYFKFSVTF